MFHSLSIDSVLAGRCSATDVTVKKCSFSDIHVEWGVFAALPRVNIVYFGYLYVFIIHEDTTRSLQKNKKYWEKVLSVLK